MTPHGKLDLQLNVLWGRDRLHIPLLADFTREASTPILIVHVQGTPSYPQYNMSHCRSSMISSGHSAVAGPSGRDRETTYGCRKR